ncbi:MAG: DUF3152 domain-containing protein [Actinomycetota bacterium]|nr:DUF3152 domain-containing protein [Actinomycetota bacterium]
MPQADEVDHDVLIARRRAATFGARPDDPRLIDTLREFSRRYGWRAYALPVLVVITIFALINAGPASKAKPARAQAGATGQADAPPVAAADIPLKSDQPGANSLNTVLAGDALPSGPAYTTTGTGSYSVLPGSSKIIGSGTLHRYSVEVEKGITGVDLAQFASTVQAVLSDPRSWAGHGGVALQRVDSGAVDFHVTLVASLTVRTLCGYDIPVETSCFQAAGPGIPVNRVVLNVARWVRGATAYVGDLTTYRIYMINHEDGHALGHEHAHECLSNGLAPVMMQQTIGLKSAVTGSLCQANAWPYPNGVADAPGAEQPDTPQNTQFQLKGD